MRKRQHIERTRSVDQRFLAIALGSILAISMLAVGSVHVPSVLIVGMVAVVVAIYALKTRLAITGTARTPAPFVILAALAAYTLVQAAPLPFGLLHAIAPSTADIWQRALLPFGESSPRWVSLSLDPGASFVEVVKWLTYAAVFLGASSLALRNGALTPLALVFGSSLLAALVTLAHGLLGATRVLGIYEPRFSAASWHIGPLLNPNNLAGYLNLGAFVGLGLLLTPAAPLPAWAFGIGVATIVGVSVTTASRAGVVALLLGLPLLATLIYLSRRRRREEGRPSTSTVRFLVGATGVGGLTFVFLGGTQATWEELYQTNVEKVRMLGWAKPMITDRPWFGIGRGAFESVFPAYRTTGGHIVYTHAENFLVQWLAEWGVLASILAVGSLVWVFRRTLPGRSSSTLGAGAWTGVAILLLQNLFDLGLEVPALGVALAATLGALWGEREREIAQMGRRITTRRWRRWQASTIALGVTVISLAGLRGWFDLAADREAVHTLVDAPVTSESKNQLPATLHAAMSRHPADPYFPLVGAIAARRAQANPLPWIERSLERAILNPRAHLFLADLLGASHRSQALLELRIAAQQEPELKGYVAEAALRLTKDFGDLLVAVPSGASGWGVLTEMATRLTDRDAHVRLGILQEAMSRAPAIPEVHLAFAEETLRQLRQLDSTLCPSDQRQLCESEIERHAIVIEKAYPSTSAAARLRAALLVQRGHPEDAEALLADRCHHVGDTIACERAWVDVASQLKAIEPMQVASRELVSTACSGTPECADSLTWIGDIMSKRREWGGALTYYTRAVQEHPTEARWLRIADASAQVGADAEEAAALENVVKLRGRMDAEIQSRLDRNHFRTMLR